MQKRNVSDPVFLHSLTAQQCFQHYLNSATSLKLPSACGINDGHLYSDREHQYNCNHSSAVLRRGRGHEGNKWTDNEARH